MLIRDAGGRVTPHTKTFVENWYRLVQSSSSTVAHPENQAARNMITDRERQIKRNRARINNPRLQELWLGTSGAAQLEYRWKVPVKSYLNDMALALSK